MDQHSLETQHLDETKRIAYEQIDQLKQEAETSAADIIAAKKEMKEETSHHIANLWGSDAFEQLAELSQFATQISDNITGYETIMRNIDKLEKLVERPYFARLDFTFPKDSRPTPIYIGRSTLKQGYKILIHDWRAPISSMFYRFSLGRASYDAPVGTISGDISLIRQYEIKDGELEYFFDADIEIVDEYLRKLLSQNASPQMKSIVETIQREQDIVIRDVSNDVLIVQGVAGSGKTSIALHRIAYLMYSGLTERLSNQSIIILSPNNVFEKYISGILPELGEENISSFILDEIYREILGVPNIQTRYQMLEAIMLGDGYWVPTMVSSLRFKCSGEFMRILDSLPIPGNEFVDILEAYSGLFTVEGELRRHADGCGASLPADAEDIIRFTHENLMSSTLFFDDATALAYLYLKHTEYEEYVHIRQVVIDEAQDYYHLHYQILKLLFPGARYTILGDINQTIAKPEEPGFYQDILDIFDKKRSSLVTLEKSFRCTNEIIRFSSRIIGMEVNAFGRAGEQPLMHRLADEQDTAILAHDALACMDEGYQSVGIICKSQKECAALYEALKDRMDVSLVSGSSKDKLTGVFILPIYLSKGLEFDAAFVWGADKERYGAEGDKSLLFIACTRALHRLRLYYAGEPSPFLRQ